MTKMKKPLPEKLKMTPDKVTIGDFLYLNGVCDAPRRLLKYHTDLETALKISMRSNDYWKNYGKQWADQHRALIKIPAPKRTKEEEKLRAIQVKTLMDLFGWDKERAVAKVNGGGEMPWTEKHVPYIARAAREWVVARANGG